jgi:phosphate transport system protein
MGADVPDELARIIGTLVTMARAAREAMRQAGAALLAADHTLATQVTVRDAEIDVLYRVVDDRVVDFVARRRPVGEDLRKALTTLQVAADLERMGDLAVHVARAVLRRHPAPVVVAQLAPLFQAMGTVADDLAEKGVLALAGRDAVLAAQLDADDDAMDELHRRLFGVILNPDWTLSVEEAVDGALLGRYYERYADHVVNIGDHVVFLATGSVAAQPRSAAAERA